MTTPTNPQGRFGTLEGVFTPCVLTILGVIMFMRSGFVVGYSGLWLGLVILGLSKLITVLTTLSLSAISTNTDVRGGGVYFMISRSLGADFGGTIGITLYIAQAVGVSFYVIGFTEAFLESFSFLYSFLSTENQTAFEVISVYKVPQFISTLIVGGLFYLTFKGADVALKVQNYVLALLLLSIASFLLGGVLDFNPETFEAAKNSKLTDSISFWVAFAIFFPAATGITAGANMSGDLKNPEKAIPLGTFLAIGFTLIIYILQFVLMAGSSSREALQSSPFAALQEMSLFGPLISLGVFAATLSSALGSFLGAPRILQAMGKDKLMRMFTFFGKGVGPSEEPQRATVLTFVIAVMVIWAGDLNAVAEVISMFFLIAYGTINLSAFVESKGGNPSFRPNFKLFHWSLALAGAIGCVIAMMKINDFYASISLIVSAAIFYSLKRKGSTAQIEDAKRGFIFKSIRDNLNLIESTKVDPKNWRPLVMSVCMDPNQQKSLIRAGSWLESERGLYTIVSLKHQTSDDYVARKKQHEAALMDLKNIVSHQKIRAFSECLVVRDFQEGFFNLLQAHSIGALKPNSIILGIPDQTDETAWPDFVKMVEIVASFNHNLILFKEGSLDAKKREKKIDIWWSGRTNGSLMILFAYLMTLNASWSGAKIRLLRILDEHEREVEVNEQMQNLVRKARISAAVKIVSNPSDPYGVIKEESAQEADFVFLGMGATDGAEARKSLQEVLPHLEGLPTTLLVWSNGEANVFA